MASLPPEPTLGGFVCLPKVAVRFRDATQGPGQEWAIKGSGLLAVSQFWPDIAGGCCRAGG